MSASLSGNPYASALGDLDPIEVLSNTVEQVEAIACRLTPETLEASPAPGKWSPREIFAHLSDCELAFSFRLRQTLSGSPDGTLPLLQPFDQDRWSEHYSAYTVPAALALFRAAREWNLALLTTVTPDEAAKQANHPERGLLSFQTIVETIAGHDRHHLEHLNGLRAG